MKLVFLSEFDPAGVMIQWREALRRYTPNECYVAFRQAFNHRADPDSQFPGRPDVIVVCPGIGDGWVGGNDVDTFRPDLPSWVGDVLGKFQDAKRVALFHGSKQTWQFRDRYARHYRDLGFELLATTLDYAHELDCVYVPPAVDVGDRRSKLRGANDQLVIVHTPTDPPNCHTREFLYWATTRGAQVSYASGWAHHLILDRKAGCHAGFDHMRGAFSVNTMEHAALGLVPIVGLRSPYRERLAAAGYAPVPWPVVESEANLAEVITLLVQSPAKTREWQRQALEHWEANFRPELVAKRLSNVFEEVLSV